MFNWLKPEYRIVRDNYLGYEVQVRRWWHWPFWVQPRTNTHPSIERATQAAEEYANRQVKYLGRLGAK